jgi:hypothetical protein
VQQHLINPNDNEAVKLFINGKLNSLIKFISRAFKRNNWSVRKISISQSVPVDCRKKAEQNSARIHEKYRPEDVDVIMNADETFLLFYPFRDKLLATTGIKRVGLAV